MKKISDWNMYLIMPSLYGFSISMHILFACKKWTVTRIQSLRLQLVGAIMYKKRLDKKGMKIRTTINYCSRELAKQYTILDDMLSFARSMYSQNLDFCLFVKCRNSRPSAWWIIVSGGRRNKRSFVVYCYSNILTSYRVKICSNYVKGIAEEL
jgi:hypothetical protein